MSHPLGGSTSSLYRPDQLAGQVVHYHHPRCDCARSPGLDDNSFCTRESLIYGWMLLSKKDNFFSYGSLVSSRRKQVYDTMTIRDLSLEQYYTWLGNENDNEQITFFFIFHLGHRLLFFYQRLVSTGSIPWRIVDTFSAIVCSKFHKEVVWRRPWVSGLSSHDNIACDRFWWICVAERRPWVVEWHSSVVL